MSIKCLIEVPTTMVLDWGEEDRILVKTFDLDALPVVGTKLTDELLKKAMCRYENEPITVKDIELNACENRYKITTSKIFIDAKYLRRIGDWKDSFSVNVKEA